MTTNPEETTNPADLDTADESILDDGINDAQGAADEARRGRDSDGAASDAPADPDGPDDSAN